MPRAKSVNQSDAVIRAALELAAAKGWENVTAAQIARAAGLKIADFYKIARDKNDVVRLVDAWVDDQMPPPPQDGNAHDRLFEILMNRFDVMQENRVALVSMVRAVSTCPEFWAAHIKQGISRLRHILGDAGINTRPGPGTAVDLVGLGLVYGLALRAWTQDDSADMAKTMAEIDKRLGQVERLRAYINL